MACPDVPLIIDLDTRSNAQLLSGTASVLAEVLSSKDTVPWRRRRRGSGCIVRRSASQSHSRTLPKKAEKRFACHTKFRVVSCYARILSRFAANRGKFPAPKWPKNGNWRVIVRTKRVLILCCSICFVCSRCFFHIMDLATRFQGRGAASRNMLREVVKHKIWKCSKDFRSKEIEVGVFLFI